MDELEAKEVFPSDRFDCAVWLGSKTPHRPLRRTAGEDPPCVLYGVTHRPAPGGKSTPLFVEYWHVATPWQALEKHLLFNL